MKQLAWMLVFAAASAGINQGETTPVNLMPVPAKLSLGQGRLTIDQTFSVLVTGENDPRVSGAVRRLFAQLSRQTGLPMRENKLNDPAKATLVIRCERRGAPVQSATEDESYHLEITPRQARLTAPNALGVLHG